MADLVAFAVQAHLALQAGSGVVDDLGAVVQRVARVEDAVGRFGVAADGEVRQHEILFADVGHFDELRGGAGVAGGLVRYHRFHEERTGLFYRVADAVDEAVFTKFGELVGLHAHGVVLAELVFGEPLFVQRDQIGFDHHFVEAVGFGGEGEVGGVDEYLCVDDGAFRGLEVAGGEGEVEGGVGLGELGEALAGVDAAEEAGAVADFETGAGDGDFEAVEDFGGGVEDGGVGLVGEEVVGRVAVD